MRVAIVLIQEGQAMWQKFKDQMNSYDANVVNGASDNKVDMNVIAEEIRGPGVRD